MADKGKGVDAGAGAGAGEEVEKEDRLALMRKLCDIPIPPAQAEYLRTSPFFMENKRFKYQDDEPCPFPCLAPQPPTSSTPTPTPTVVDDPRQLLAAAAAGIILTHHQQPPSTATGTSLEQCSFNQQDSLPIYSSDDDDVDDHSHPIIYCSSDSDTQPIDTEDRDWWASTDDDDDQEQQDSLPPPPPPSQPPTTSFTGTVRLSQQLLEKVKLFKDTLDTVESGSGGGNARNAQSGSGGGNANAAHMEVDMVGRGKRTLPPSLTPSDPPPLNNNNTSTSTSNMGEGDRASGPEEINKKKKLDIVEIARRRGMTFPTSPCV